MQQGIGFIGLGRMGGWMAANLVQAGLQLSVYDVNPAARQILREQGAGESTSPADVARKCKTIIMCLPDTHTIDTVVWGEKGIVSGWAPSQPAHQGPANDCFLIDCGTSDYQWTLAFDAELAKLGISFADAPVTGLEKRAREGSLTIMFGGPQILLDRARPVLEIMGNRILHMGAVGSGQLTKLVNNLLYNANLAAMAEILPMAIKLGLDPEQVTRVVNSGSGRSFASETFLPQILEGEFYNSYSLNNAYKDMAGAMRIAAEQKTPLPMVSTAMATYQMALRQGLGEQDKGAMIKVFEKLLQVRFRKSESA